MRAPTVWVLLLLVACLPYRAQTAFENTRHSVGLRRWAPGECTYSDLVLAFGSSMHGNAFKCAVDVGKLAIEPVASAVMLLTEDADHEERVQFRTALTDHGSAAAVWALAMDALLDRQWERGRRLLLQVRVLAKREGNAALETAALLRWVDALPDIPSRQHEPSKLYLKLALQQISGKSGEEILTQLAETYSALPQAYHKIFHRFVVPALEECIPLVNVRPVACPDDDFLAVLIVDDAGPSAGRSCFFARHERVGERLLVVIQSMGGGTSEPGTSSGRTGAIDDNAGVIEQLQEGGEACLTNAARIDSDSRIRIVQVAE